MPVQRTTRRTAGAGSTTKGGPRKRTALLSLTKTN
jgi:hypothetical protein